LVTVFQKRNPHAAFNDYRMNRLAIGENVINLTPRALTVKKDALSKSSIRAHLNTLKLTLSG
jgi:hypothetical protein